MSMRDISNKAIIEILDREYAAARSYLGDELGLYIIAHEQRHQQRPSVFAVADTARLVFDRDRKAIDIEGNDFTGIAATARFHYRGQKHFPLCGVMFKPQAIHLSRPEQVSAKEEHLMRAGVVLIAETESAHISIIDSGPLQMIAEYKDDMFVLRIGGVDLSAHVVSAIISVNFIHGSIAISNLNVRL